MFQPCPSLDDRCEIYLKNLNLKLLFQDEKMLGAKAKRRVWRSLNLKLIDCGWLCCRLWVAWLELSNQLVECPLIIVSL
jgi:hypothetical protein